MTIALGLKAHSGWAALVALGRAGDRHLSLVDRRRLVLADADDGPWARQPYHAAEELPPARARAIVKRGVETARALALAEMNDALARARAAGHGVAACAVLVGEPMPDWSVDEILAVHFRMHKAEGALYRDVLIEAAEACGVMVVPILEKQLAARGDQILKGSLGDVALDLARLGKSAGAPWGKDQKDAALAAAIALEVA